MPLTDNVKVIVSGVYQTSEITLEGPIGMEVGTAASSRTSRATPISITPKPDFNRPLIVKG